MSKIFYVRFVIHNGTRNFDSPKDCTKIRYFSTVIMKVPLQGLAKPILSHDRINEIKEVAELQRGRFSHESNW